MADGTIWNASDHDTLIEIKTTLMLLRQDFLDTRAALTAHLGEHDGRLRKLEDMATQYSLPAIVQKYDRMWNEWEDRKVHLAIEERMRTRQEHRMWAIAAAVATVISGALHALAAYTGFGQRWP